MQSTYSPKGDRLQNKVNATTTQGGGVLTASIDTINNELVLKSIVG